MKFAVAAAAVICVLATAACTPIRDQHGFVPDEALPTEIKPEIDTRATVLQRLGSPTAKANFDENIWYYMSYTERSFAFYTPKVTSRKITVIEFDGNDVVRKVSQVNQQDGQKVRLSRRETPTRGRELGLFEQIFGTIGRLPTDGTGVGPGGGQQNPGGGGQRPGGQGPR